jgi:hypothetical protein
MIRRKELLLLENRLFVLRKRHRSSENCADSSKPLVNSRISLEFGTCGKDYFIAPTELHINDSLTLCPKGYIDCIVDELPLSLGTYYLSPYFEVNGVSQDFVHAAATLQVEDGNFYGTGKDYPPGWVGKTVLVKHRWEPASETAPASDEQLVRAP